MVFPSPSRLPGGHRRYSERDVESVLDVLRLRAQGLSLPAAIAQSRRHASGETSVFAGLRRRRPEIAPASLPKQTVLALSNAIEDEYLARATRGLVFGSFQRERFYRIAQRRWRELARTADLAVAVAGFERADEPFGSPAEVPIEVPPPARARVDGDRRRPRSARLSRRLGTAQSERAARPRPAL